MAYLIPENLGSRSDVPLALQQVARGFRDLLGDDVTAVYDTTAEEAPLVVIDPQAGVLAIHVVEGGARGLSTGLLAKLRGEQPIMEELRRGLPATAQEPLERVAASPHLSRGVPTAAAYAASTVSATQADRRGLDASSMLLQHDFHAERLRPALRRLLGGTITPLRDREEKAVRAAVTPQIVIRDRENDRERPGQLVFRAPETDGEDVLAVLDRQQQNLAMHLGDGYRVIRGVAGSGKSLVLTHRARHLARAMPDARILLTCFNIVLGRALAAQLEDVPNVTVAHIDSFAWRVCRSANVRMPRGDERFLRQRELAAEALSAERVDEHFDVVLVDEGQDFDAAAFDLAYQALKPRREHFVVALDAAQNIYRKRGRWNPPGLSARGRTRLMRLNYRNTKEILELAYALLSRGAEIGEGEGGLDDSSVVVPPEATARRGQDPVVVQAADAHAELRAITKRVQEFNREGVPWSDILVLYGSTKFGKRLYRAMEEKGIPYFDVSFSNNNKKNVMQVGDVVRGSTIQAIKGLEFSHVLICGVNEIYTGGDEDEVGKRRLLYVGMTRATDVLHVTVQGSGSIGADLLRAAS